MFLVISYIPLGIFAVNVHWKRVDVQMFRFTALVSFRKEWREGVMSPRFRHHRSTVIFLFFNYPT